MALQEHYGHFGNAARFPDFMNDAFVYFAIRLESSRIYQGLPGGSMRFWSRRYGDFFLNSAAENTS